MQNQEPQKTALYRHYDKDDKLLYVGISLSAVNRLIQHKASSSWACDAVCMKTEWFDSRLDAIEAEKEAIKKESPIHNIVHSKKDKAKVRKTDEMYLFYLLNNLGLTVKQAFERYNESSRQNIEIPDKVVAIGFLVDGVNYQFEIDETEQNLSYEIK